uniref:Uncharacterized protein n=1 Tax=viral metagenome TaxID=1070528 RepID=A0A6C0I7S1_9ZZZZ
MTCPLCSKGGRRTKTRKAGKGKRGGTLVGDAILAGTALGLYSYFNKNKRGGGGSRTARLPLRKTRRALV